MIKESIAFIGISQSLFAVLILASRKKVTVSDLILIGCLLATSLRFLAKIPVSLSATEPIKDISAGIIPLTFGPFFYLYTKYLTRDNPPFDNRDWLHFIPFSVYLIVSLVLFGGQISFNEIDFFKNDNFLWVRVIFGLVFFSSVMVYTIFITLMLADYRKNRSINIDHSNDGTTLFWLNFVSILFITLIITYIIIGGINALTFSNQFDLDFISNIGLIVLVYAVSYFGIKQPSKLYFGYYKSQKSENRQDSASYGKPRYDPSQLEMLANELRSYMEEEKPYLQPDLSLANLASKLNIPKPELTYLLNNFMGANFFSFVNQYRLKAVIQKLENPKYDHLTILSIAFDCGFNSKSTFNGLFKQLTGMTPTEYRLKPSM